MTGSIAEATGLLRNGVPLIDVRAPAEFSRGAFDQAVNLPLLDDDERRRVGIRYKQAGQRSAIALGEALVSGNVREERLRSWLGFVDTHPDAAIYCWRGGLRSRIVQQWMADAGTTLPRVAGGFKALRKLCLCTNDRIGTERALWVIGGRAGSGKTRLLNTFERAIDLERLANHRGSAFGGDLSAQPTPVHFENRLACAFLRLPETGTLLIEDESRTIGRLAIPENLFGAMQAAPLVILECSITERTANVVEEYVTGPLSNGVSSELLCERYSSALDRIQRRLGGARHQELVGAVRSAFSTSDLDRHRFWIRCLLTWYYDPMYEYQDAKKSQRVEFRGEFDAVQAYLKARG